jgi:hypothetical protein
MKTLLCLLALVSSSTAFAGSFTLVDNITQETYTCTSGGGSGGDEGADCIERVQKVCSKEFSSGCYKSAANNCKDKSRSFGRCVEATYNACSKEFASGCFKSAVANCK